MASDGVVKAIDVTPKRVLGLGSGLENGAPDPVRFQGLEEGLDDGSVEALAFPGHRDPDTMVLQFRLIGCRAILTAAVRVMDQAS